MEIIEKNLTINYEKLEYGNNPERIIWHHIEAANATIEDVNQWHLNKGWACIGYNFYVRKNGEIFKGRPIEAIGAHCMGQNDCSIGIAFEGDFMAETMEEAQINGGIELTTYLKDKYGIKEVGGHKEYGDTNCPGDNFPLDKFKSYDNSSGNRPNGYVVTKYLKNAYEGYDGVDLSILSLFSGARCYMRHDDKGMWIESQWLSYDECLEVKTKLEDEHLFHDIIET